MYTILIEDDLVMKTKSETDVDEIDEENEDN